VPRDDLAESRLQRPVGEAEQPAAEDDLLPGLGLERVGIPPRRLRLTESVPDEPEVPPGLEVVAGPRRLGPSKERVVRVPQRRPRRESGRRQEEG
nr:hypothetical protein [Actinomycetota bacterium]